MNDSTVNDSNENSNELKPFFFATIKKVGKLLSVCLYENI